MKIDKIAIVVVAYRRFDSFMRLMDSVAKIQTTYNDIPLIISVDFHKNNKKIIEFSENFQWKYGDKEIIAYKEKQGLKKHILNCGNLTSKYESVIILEDDLLVSPYFYDFAISACNFYYDEPKISGFSLYAYERAESANFSFRPIYDSFDAFFIQFPSSWGQCWLKKHWQEFIKWLEKNESENILNNLLPDFVLAWPDTSWKKYFVAYLINCEKYFVFPKIGLTTNFGEVGQHHVNQLNIRQVELLSRRIEFKLPTFEESYAKYDVGFELEYVELLKLNPELKKLPKFNVDFYCKKNHAQNDIILTTADTENTIHSFSGKLTPLINNIIFNIPGNELVITKYKDVELKSVGIYDGTFISELKFLCREIMRLIYYKYFYYNKFKQNI